MRNLDYHFQMRSCLSDSERQSFDNYLLGILAFGIDEKEWREMVDDAVGMVKVPERHVIDTERLRCSCGTQMCFACGACPKTCDCEKNVYPGGHHA